jgi:hypothetical protein
MFELPQLPMHAEWIVNTVSHSNFQFPICKLTLDIWTSGHVYEFVDFVGCVAFDHAIAPCRLGTDQLLSNSTFVSIDRQNPSRFSPTSQMSAGPPRLWDGDVSGRDKFSCQVPCGWTMEFSFQSVVMIDSIYTYDYGLGVLSVSRKLSDTDSVWTHMAAENRSCCGSPSPSILTLGRRGMNFTAFEAKRLRINVTGAAFFSFWLEVIEMFVCGATATLTTTTTTITTIMTTTPTASTTSEPGDPATLSTTSLATNSTTISNLLPTANQTLQPNSIATSTTATTTIAVSVPPSGSQSDSDVGLIAGIIVGGGIVMVIIIGISTILLVRCMRDMRPQSSSDRRQVNEMRATPQPRPQPQSQPENQTRAQSMNTHNNPISSATTYGTQDMDLTFDSARDPNEDSVRPDVPSGYSNRAILHTHSDRHYDSLAPHEI